MKKINFTNATVTAPASVEIEGVSHDVTPAVIEGGTLPTPDNMNQLQNNVEECFNGTTSMGKIVVDDISCKNKFNMNGNILESIGYTSGTNTLESGKIKSTANFANGNGKGQIIQLKPNTVYTYSVKISSFEVSGSTSLRISPVNSEGNAVGYLVDQAVICEVGKVYSYSFTTSDTGKIWVMLNGISNVEDYSILKYVVYDYIQIEEGSTATNYSEYKGIGYTSGQNANGKWVKYDDGRLECWGKASIPANQTNTTITFPIPFLEPNKYGLGTNINVSITDIYTNSYFNVYIVAEFTNNNFKVFAFTAAGGTPTVQRDFFFNVKGFWK